jgi:hypothetical protein
MLLAAALCACLVGCAAPNELRDQQAEYLKRHCLSIVLRANVPLSTAERVTHLHPSRFRVGNLHLHGGVDALNAC